MERLAGLAGLKSGSPQSRIEETSDPNAPTYYFYGQEELEADLFGEDSSSHGARFIETNDDVLTLQTGDLVFSLISGKATTVGRPHDGFLFTQNYVCITPPSTIDANYLAYLLNEDSSTRHQLLAGRQGSKLLKSTVRQLSELEIAGIPSLEVQKTIGSLYRNQLKLESLKKQQAMLETKFVLARMKGAH